MPGEPIGRWERQRLRVRRGNVEDPWNLIQVMLAKGKTSLFGALPPIVIVSYDHEQTAG